jgi:BASS family bile acid:Na+ symporter
VSTTEPLTVNSLKIAAILLGTQLLPLCAGIALRHWGSRLAHRLHKPATILSKVLNLAVVIVILATQYRSLSQITPRALVGMLSLLIASLAAGYLLSVREPATRRAMTLTTSLRNVGVGLVIASGNFAGTPAVTAVLLYGLIEIAGALLVALWWGQTASRHRLAMAGSQNG